MYRISYIIIFFTTVCFAQKSQDTIIVNNQYFVKHIVRYNQTLEYISDLYNVKKKDIILHNETNGRLYYNQLLYIPIILTKSNRLSDSRIQKNSPFSFSSKKKNKILKDENISSKNEEYVENSRAKVALLLPLYISKNDTLEKMSEDQDNNITHTIYDRSKIALSFFQGVKLGIDSLEMLGKSISLYVFDTENDSLKTLRLVSSGYLDTMDLIIGPFFSKNFAIVTDKYGRDNTKKIVFPLSRVSAVKENPSVYQLNTLFKFQAKDIRDFVLKRHKKKPVYIFYQSNDKVQAFYMHQLFKREKKKTYLKYIDHTHVDSLRGFLKKDQCVIIPSYDKIFVSNILSSLGSIDSNFVTFGLNNWKNFENIDVQDLMDLNVHISDPYYFDSQNAFEKRFVYLFENNYKASFDRFSYIGYKTILHFCSSINIFKFEKNKFGDGNVNVKAPIFYYEDFQLKPIDM